MKLYLAKTATAILILLLSMDANSFQCAQFFSAPVKWARQIQQFFDLTQKALEKPNFISQDRSGVENINPALRNPLNELEAILHRASNTIDMHLHFIEKLGTPIFIPTSKNRKNKEIIEIDTRLKEIDQILEAMEQFQEIAKKQFSEAGPEYQKEAEALIRYADALALRHLLILEALVPGP